MPPDLLPAMLGPFFVLPTHGNEAHGNEEEDWLFRIYASSREFDADVTSRHLDSQRTLLEHEFNSRQRSYPIDFPGVVFFLLHLHTSPVGRLYVQITPRVVFIVDLVLLPTHRGSGHGTALLADLTAWAHRRGLPVRLHVARHNTRAAALYERLGFRVIEELTQHRLMDYAKPPPEPGPAEA
jgi:ribosomal protein S18 acetylase RimI-like enzyme